MPQIDKPNYTQVPNLFFDEIMSGLSGGAVLVYLAICRKTIGWHKETDAISYSQIAKMTGQNNRSIHSAILELEKAGIIQIDRVQYKTTFYTMLFRNGTSSSSETEQDFSKSSSETEHTKESLKETVKKKHLPQAASAVADKPTRYQQIIDLFDQTHRAAFNGEPYPAAWGRDTKCLKRLDKHPLDLILSRVPAYFRYMPDDQFCKRNIPAFVALFNDAKLRRAVPLEEPGIPAELQEPRPDEEPLWD